MGILTLLSFLILIWTFYICNEKKNISKFNLYHDEMKHGRTCMGRNNQNKERNSSVRYKLFSIGFEQHFQLDYPGVLDSGGLPLLNISMCMPVASFL